MTMTFEEFKTNVEQWAVERGIYEHSTAMAQALKACSEAGELCDAVIKGDRDAMADAVGDVAVCVVNAHRLSTGSRLRLTDDFSAENGREVSAALVVIECAEMVIKKGMFAHGVLYELQGFCAAANLDFMECCEKAWLEIKDRKGRMVPGGAFVKD